jgi:DNA-binding FadR family transcriptional regulator
MNTQRIKSPESLSSLVYEKILAAITNGEYSVNKKLPTEAQLCDIYNVSRPVIRESLTQGRQAGGIQTGFRQLSNKAPR